MHKYQLLLTLFLIIMLLIDGVNVEELDLGPLLELNFQRELLLWLLKFKFKGIGSPKSVLLNNRSGPRKSLTEKYLTGSSILLYEMTFEKRTLGWTSS